MIERIVAPKDVHFLIPEMCKYFTLVEGLNGNLNCFVTETGTWWGTELIENNTQKRQIQSADIDVVGISASDKAIIVGECKFKNEKIDKSIYEVLVRRSKVIPSKYPIVQYLLFSLSGFTEWFDENIDKRIVKLYTLYDLYKTNE